MISSANLHNFHREGLGRNRNETDSFEDINFLIDGRKDGYTSMMTVTLNFSTLLDV